MALKRLVYLLLREVILNIKHKIIDILIGTVTKESNGNEETGVTATRRGDIKHNIIDILCHYYRYCN